MDLIAAIASINAFIIAFLISNKKQKGISDYILIAWVINFAFQFAIPFFIERHILIRDSIWGSIMGIIVVAHAPFLFVYTNSLTNTDFKVNIKNFYHFGFVLIVVISFIPYFTLSHEERMNLVIQRQDLSYFVLLPMLMLLSIQIYFLVRTIIVVIRHQYSINQSFSYEAKINLTWIKLIAYGFFGVIIISFILYVLVSAQIITIFWMDYILIISNMILFFYIAYSGYKQNAIEKLNSTISPIDNKVESYVKSMPKSESPDPVPSQDYDRVIIELLQTMESEKLYLEPELNVGNIANKLNVHAHQLSKLINSQLEKNFFEFVNEYRVEEFKKLVTDPRNKHISILGLAMDAGFNSKATFNRFFKSKTGLTPSAFKESYKF